MAAARFVHAVEVIAARGAGQDRAEVFTRGDGMVVALADGAGGTGNGAIAAQAVVDAVGAAGPGTDWAALLATLDRDSRRLRGGQSTAVVLEISGAAISGASVGDSGAWLITVPSAGVTDGSRRRLPLDPSPRSRQAAIRSNDRPTR
jgi:serine/threonine protein phosphatase PrpC